MDTKTLLVVGGLVALLAYATVHRDGETAGDDESDIFSDALEALNMSGWPSNSEPYQDSIATAAERHGVPVAILAWLLWKESRYNPAIINGSKRSRAGALGIAQFMPATAREELGSAEAALDPDTAINGAARYLSRLCDRLDGDWRLALAAYNWGIGNVQRKGIDAAPAETVDYYTAILTKANYV